MKKLTSKPAEPSEPTESYLSDVDLLIKSAMADMSAMAPKDRILCAERLLGIVRLLREMRHGTSEGRPTALLIPGLAWAPDDRD